jgi:UDP-N-acetylglucosamine 2-epimerase
MAPVVLELERRAGIESLLCSTGQHRELLNQALETFGLVPDFELGLMEPDQRLTGLTARLLEGIDRVVAETEPDWLLAQGDTTTVFASAVVAFYAGVRFGHVEAGLRTGDLRSPYPEEMNRRLADQISTALFAPTERARATLLTEGHAPESVFLTGNTAVDAVLAIAARPYDRSAGPLAAVPDEAPVVLVTAHRRESFGGPLENICTAVRDLAARVPEAAVIFPVHLNPHVQETVYGVLGAAPNVQLVAPVDYVTLVQLMRHAAVILTDSGGIQEEAPTFGVPVLVMREKTERREAVDAGFAELVGTDPAAIANAAERLLRSERPVLDAPNPFGDGRAAERIVDVVLEWTP